MVRPPNILWIVTTQWRAQAFGYAGDVNARTPFLDAFAQRSMNYRQAVTPHPMGPFARAALLTGEACPENGITDYFDPLPVGTRTVAHDLAERGYATAFFGKWHLANRNASAPLVGDTHARMVVRPENRVGFQFWEGFESGFLLNDPWLHGSRLQVPQQFHGYQSDVVCDRAAEFLRGTRPAAESSATQSPWFAVVSLEAPHPPYDAPSAGVPRRDPMQLQLRPNVPQGSAAEERARTELVGYYGHIEATDRAIGRLLKRVGDDHTKVVFTSVHGDMHGAHGLFRKGWPYEESIRVPLLVGGAHSGRGSSGPNDEAISLIDLRRAAVEWAEGRSGANRVASSAISMPSVVALPLQCDRAWRGVRSPTHKLILNADRTPWLYFDLQADPYEQSNLANDPSRAAEIDRLRALV
ncbi:MAG: sulfatase-like hydrolase/transferase [Opitutus sp.]